MSIGSRLKELRIKKDLTLEEVGNAIGTTKQTLYKYENGLITNIPSDKIESLSKVYDVSPSYIMGWDDDDTYYLNPESARIAQEAYDNPDLRILFDAAKDVEPEALKTVIDMVKLMKKKEHPELEDYADEFPEEEIQDFPED